MARNLQQKVWSMDVWTAHWNIRVECLWSILIEGWLLAYIFLARYVLLQMDDKNSGMLRMLGVISCAQTFMENAFTCRISLTGTLLYVYEIRLFPKSGLQEPARDGWTLNLLVSPSITTIQTLPVCLERKIGLLLGWSLQRYCSSFGEQNTHDKRNTHTQVVRPSISWLTNVHQPLLYRGIPNHTK